MSNLSSTAASEDRPQSSEATTITIQPSAEKIERGIEFGSINGNTDHSEALIQSDTSPTTSSSADATLNVENATYDVQSVKSINSIEDTFSHYQQGNTISFSSFLMIETIKAVLKNQLLSSDSLLELFQIYDKDNDKRLRLDEFTELMEIIDLSYGHLLKVESKFDPNERTRSGKHARKLTYKGPVETMTPQNSLSSEEEDINLSLVPESDHADFKEEVVTVQPLLIVVPPSPAKHKDAAASELAPPPPTPPSSFVKRTSINYTPVGVASTSSERRFIAAKPEVNKRSKVDGKPPLTPSTSTPFGNSHSISQSSSTELFSPSGRPLSMKKGFIVKKDEGDLKASRFFTLNDGNLTYYDSASKTPPFSLDRRTIALSGVSVSRVGESTLQLCRGDAATESPSHSRPSSGTMTPSSREVLSLEIKNAQDREAWLSAIQEHIDFSSSLDKEHSNGSSSRLGLQYEYFSGSSRSEVDVA